MAKLLFLTFALLSAVAHAFIPGRQSWTRPRQQQSFLTPAAATTTKHVISSLQPRESSLGNSRAAAARSHNTQLQLGFGAFSGDAITSQLSIIFASSGRVPLPQSLLVNVVLFTLGRRKLLSSLTFAGYAHAFALGTALWAVTGWKGWSVCVLYLILGSLVTKVKFDYKEEQGLAEGRGGRRGPENVWGSAATGLACAIASTQSGIFNVSPSLFIVAYVASLATKLADTFASEIGKAYGKTTFLITTFQRVPPGTEGAVSAEGTAAAVVGGFLLSMYANLIGLIDLPSVALCTAAAFVATNVESVVGATLQEKKGMAWMTNEVVNFINTLVGAGLAIAGGKALLGM
ncbi:hypothetical protein MPSEU_000958000 [Mayamaea pseudoterrestris]|nr:hypothetical protein MPSEU_000958000 [Mayamaea pseudoterrestris]